MQTSVRMPWNIMSDRKKEHDAAMKHALQAADETRAKNNRLAKELNHCKSKLLKCNQDAQERIEVAQADKQKLQRQVERRNALMAVYSTHARPLVSDGGVPIFAVLVWDDAPAHCGFEMVLDRMFRNNPRDLENTRSHVFAFNKTFVLEIKTLGGAVMHRVALARREKKRGMHVSETVSWFGSLSDGGPETGAVPAVDLRGASFIATIRRQDEKLDVVVRNGERAEVRVQHKTPLMDAVSEVSEHKTRQLLQDGADVRAATEIHRRTALHYAALHVETIEDEDVTVARDRDLSAIVQMLLDSGADTSARDMWGQDALDVAIRRGNIACSSVLIKHEESLEKAADTARQQAEVDRLAATEVSKQVYKQKLVRKKQALKAGANLCE